MLEQLYACALLMQLGLTSPKDYREQLDALFLAHPDNPLLMELEWRSGDIRDTIGRIRAVCENAGIDPIAVGRPLFEALERVYRDGRSLESFAALVLKLGNMLPFEFKIQEPYASLIYADERLDWGGPSQTRKLYEQAFAFYHSR